jgi:hypothetical protein
MYVWTHACVCAERESLRVRVRVRVRVLEDECEVESVAQPEASPVVVVVVVDKRGSRRAVHCCSSTARALETGISLMLGHLPLPVMAVIRARVCNLAACLAPYE